MTATAPSMQLHEPPAAQLPAWKPGKRPGLTGTLTDMVVGGDLLPAVVVAESANCRTIVVPLGTLDARKIYILATQRSIVIDCRVTSTVCRAGSVHKGIQQQRGTRELLLTLGFGRAFFFEAQERRIRAQFLN